MKSLVVLVFILGVVLPASAHEQDTRYRGEYSYGHEVNVFCPEINSQCYWLSPETDLQLRTQLKQLVEQNTNQAYEKICIVVEGKINRDPAAKQRIGFATDYDGLFTVSRLHGLCDKVTIVTEGDLQHRRWVLESVNGTKIDPAKFDNRVPELEIGEQMMASGNAGCNRFSGKAALREDQFIIARAVTTRMICKPEQNEMERLFLQLLSQESEIAIDVDSNLLLKTPETQLKFRLEDRV